MNNYTLLVINPGSTSTKIAIYENYQEKFVKNIEHSSDELSQYKLVAEQFDMRKKAVLAFLKSVDFDTSNLSAVVARGGLLPPVKSGAYIVNEQMIDRLRNRPVADHASNLGAMVGYAIAQPLGIQAYIYDSVAVDELEPIARVTGIPEVKKRSLIHALNMRSVALKVAEGMGQSYYDLNFIIAHLGGGITLAAHQNGKMIDAICDDEGPFSPERAGQVASSPLVDVCFSGEYDHRSVIKKLRGKGGLVALLGTNKAIEVEERIKKGDKVAELVYSAMAYQIAKNIGQLATVVKGKVDKIILTGGIAHSRLLTGWVKERVEFIAPVAIVPGENEMEALAMGALRVLNNEEHARVYDLG